MKTTGRIATAKINITSPLKLDIELDITDLMLLIGQNGTGKSFILAMNWFISLISNFFVMGKGKLPIGTSIVELNRMSKATFDSEIDGIVTMVFESGASVTVTYQKGELVNVYQDKLDKVEHPTIAIYLSSGMRLFSAMRTYLAARKYNLDPKTGEPSDRLMEMYKLYDIMYIESLISKSPITIPPIVTSNLKELGVEEEIEIVEVDTKTCDFYCITKDKKKRNLLTFSAGNQAVINMMIANL